MVKSLERRLKIEKTDNDGDDVRSRIHFNIKYF